MQKKLLVAVLGTLFALPAFAEDAPAAAAAPAPVVTSNISLVTNYLYRGVSQTAGNPAIQGGFDYTPASGFYAGVWGSSISWISDGYVAATPTTPGAGATGAGTEIDTYLGFRNSFATDFSYDVGFLRYNYPGNYADGAVKADTNEVYALIGYKWITLKYSDALGDTFGVSNAGGTSYIDLSASYALGDSGYTLGAHYGAQTYTGSTTDTLKAAGLDPTYKDYKVSVTKDFGNTYVVGLTYSSTDAKSGGFYTVNGKDLGKSTVVANVTRTF